MYITYDDYTEMGGTLDSTAFSSYIYRAESVLLTRTQGRITNVTEAVKHCVKELVELYAEYGSKESNVASFSHDGLSETFREKTEKTRGTEAERIMRDFLALETAEDGTPLLYLGV